MRIPAFHIIIHLLFCAFFSDTCIASSISTRELRGLGFWRDANSVKKPPLHKPNPTYVKYKTSIDYAIKNGIFQCEFDIDEIDAEGLIKVLPNNAHTLDLSNQEDLSSEAIYLIIEKSRIMWEHINLNDTNFGGQLLQPIRFPSTLRILSVSGLNISEAQLIQLLKSIHKTSIKELDLSNNFIKFEQLKGAVKWPVSLESLNLSFINLRESLAQVSRSINESRNIKHLYLNGCEIGDPEAEWFMSHLKKPLESLELKYNKITQRSYDKLREIFHDSGEIGTLDLSCNKITPPLEGVSLRLRQTSLPVTLLDLDL